MPWRERSLVNIRQEFVLRAQTGEWTIAELCRQFDVSRKTGYKWLRRFQANGTAGLVDQSRRPRSNSLRVSAEVVTAIVRLKHKHKNWGAKKLWVVLSRSYNAPELPSMSSINRVLYSSGLVRKRRRYRQQSMGIPLRPRVEVHGPNDLWTADFKGWWRAGDGERCEPLTVRDAHSRFVLELRVLSSIRERYVRPVFEELFEKYGVPKAIQTDNGPPFASRGLAGLTRLSAWWLSLGIDVVRSRPGKPTDNGGHERMHADVRIDIEAEAARSRRAQQLACDEWRTEFNHIRPHEALGMKVPADLYRPSSRRPGRIIVGGYPDDCQVRNLDNNGMIRDGRKRAGVYVSLAVRGYQVGLQPREDGRIYVWFFDRLLGSYDPEGDLSVQPVPVLLPESSKELHRKEVTESSPNG
jgi:transposase InsO family protein